jgi:hypothetical protein
MYPFSYSRPQRLVGHPAPIDVVLSSAVRRVRGHWAGRDRVVFASRPVPAPVRPEPEVPDVRSSPGVCGVLTRPFGDALAAVQAFRAP